MGISRSELISAILNAQDNLDDEYYELFEIYKSSFQDDIINSKFTKEFIVTDGKLINYIHRVLTT